MTTIDHAAEARKALDAAIEVPADVEAAADPWLLAAQVHATLALVEAQREANEQARIANLIAYVRLLETQYAAAKQNSEDFDLSTYQASLARHKAALGAIREGLGL